MAEPTADFWPTPLAIGRRPRGRDNLTSLGQLPVALAKKAGKPQWLASPVGELPNSLANPPSEMANRCSNLHASHAWAGSLSRPPRRGLTLKATETELSRQIRWQREPPVICSKRRNLLNQRPRSADQQRAQSTSTADSATLLGSPIGCHFRQLSWQATPAPGRIRRFAGQKLIMLVPQLIEPKPIGVCVTASR